jgi:8-oxo-dGTP pyrophosphatase MutT (NUDIX family)
MIRVGVCKDRLAEAFERFGRVPIEKRTVAVGRDHPVFKRNERVPFWSAGGLIHDQRGRVLLLRHVPSKGWGDAWLTPGGRLEEGETVLDGLRREVLEELGIDIEVPVLSRILQQNITDGRRVRRGYFAQFVARAATADLHPGSDVREIRWFDELPPDMAFREDYLEDFRHLKENVSDPADATL